MSTPGLLEVTKAPMRLPNGGDYVTPTGVSETFDPASCGELVGGNDIRGKYVRFTAVGDQISFAEGAGTVSGLGVVLVDGAFTTLYIPPNAGVIAMISAGGGGTLAMAWTE